MDDISILFISLILPFFKLKLSILLRIPFFFVFNSRLLFILLLIFLNKIDCILLLNIPLLNNKSLFVSFILNSLKLFISFSFNSKFFTDLFLLLILNYLNY